MFIDEFRSNANVNTEKQVRQDNSSGRGRRMVSWNRTLREAPNPPEVILNTLMNANKVQTISNQITSIKAPVETWRSLTPPGYNTSSYPNIVESQMHLLQSFGYLFHSMRTAHDIVLHNFVREADSLLLLFAY